MTNALPLFDELDASPGRVRVPSASWFERANRADGTDWANVRDALESWYSRFPDATGDLRSRLRAKDQNSLSAFFELFLNELFQKMNLNVAVGPELPTGSRPDFLITTSVGDSVYVEATVVTGDRDNSHERAVFGAINALDGEVPRNVGVAACTTGALRSTPRLRTIKNKVRRWLEGLSQEALGAEPVTSAPRLTIPPPEVDGDWRLALSAVRRCGGRVIQGMQSDVLLYGKSIREALEAKASQHRGADRPVVLTANDIGRYFDEEHLFPAFWQAHPEIAAALVFDRCVPWDDADRWLVYLEVNPAHADRLPRELLTLADSAGPSVREVLGLPEGWPDPDGNRATRDLLHDLFA